MVNSNTNTNTFSLSNCSPNACIISLDIGAKHTGVAIYRVQDKLIAPLTTISLSQFNGKKWFVALEQQLSLYWDQIALFVIGTHPHQSTANFVQNYINQVIRILNAWTNITIVTHIETNSSIWAQQFLSDKNFSRDFINKHENAVAASRILWGYLLTQHQIDALILYPR